MPIYSIATREIITRIYEIAAESIEEAKANMSDASLVYEDNEGEVYTHVCEKINNENRTKRN